jgi:hypothetical protein
VLAAAFSIKPSIVDDDVVAAGVFLSLLSSSSLSDEKPSSCVFGASKEKITCRYIGDWDYGRIYVCYGEKGNIEEEIFHIHTFSDLLFNFLPFFHQR